jgi:hypothetical protein
VLSLFAEVASRRSPVELRYSADDYLANLATQSGTRALGEGRSADFLVRVRKRLEALGWPRPDRPRRRSAHGGPVDLTT